ncbi:MAG: amidohydrolase family protein [Chloroflexi bacterium]|nr:amidohydrolase family protein [Chloroflexota bacterium]
MRRKKTDPELPILLPFQPGPASNGEYVPPERTPAHELMAAIALERAEEIARKRGIDRRRFLAGLGGLAVTLGAVNLVACSSDDGSKQAQPRPGGTFEVPEDADPDAVCELLEGDEFIFDVQTHHITVERSSQEPGLELLLRRLHPGCGEDDKVECGSRYHYLKDIFLDSDTTMAVLSDTPTPSDDQGALTFADMRRTMEIIDMLSSGGAGRLLLHSIVVPNVGSLEQQLDLMQARAEAMQVAAWKVYTPYGGPDNRPWSLDDEQFGIPLIEKARELGVKRICAHKGLPLFGFDPSFSSPRDIGVVAKAYPDMTFVVYHSGYDPNAGAEGPYDPDDAERGVNALVKSLQDNGIPPNSNVYAELGTTWRAVMSNPTEAAHVLGKLLKYVGEERVIWGTDCIWYGAPQPQIVAFRTFRMDPELREQHGYPELTRDLKAKVFGLNAARLYGVDADAQRCVLDRDQLEGLREAYRDLDPDSHELRWAPRGPISRRGMLRLAWEQGGRWSPWR